MRVEVLENCTRTYTNRMKDATCNICQNVLYKLCNVYKCFWHIVRMFMNRSHHWIFSFLPHFILLVFMLITIYQQANKCSKVHWYTNLATFCAMRNVAVFCLLFFVHHFGNVAVNIECINWHEKYRRETNNNESIKFIRNVVRFDTCRNNEI